MVLSISNTDVDNIRNKIETCIASNAELEVIFKQSINSDTFKKILGYFNTIVEEEDTLDIRYKRDIQSNVRTSFIGRDIIKLYCIHGELSKNYMNQNIVFINKERISDPVDIAEYDIRINLNSENTLSREQVILYIENFDTKTKTFRYKKRFSSKTSDGLFRFDFSVIKSSKRNRSGELVGYKNINESGVFRDMETYEIEMEFIIDSSSDKNVIYKSFINNIYYMLNIINDTYYILPKSKITQSFENYKQLIGETDTKKYFIGPQPLTLEFKNIVDISDIKADSNSAMLKNINININIRNKYSVTDKADGERMLLFIDQVGYIFLINNRLSMKYVGIQMPDYSNTIIDGEYIRNGINNDIINLYMAFDIYFLKDEDVRNRVLYKSREDKDIKEKTRYELLIDVIKVFNNDGASASQAKKRNAVKQTIANDTTKITIKMKNFLFGDYSKSGDKIFVESSKIYENREQLLYKIDGLIYTPVNLPVGGMFPDDKAHNNRTWNNVLKWKPPEDNTIDFLVVFEKDTTTDKNKIVYRAINDGPEVGRVEEYNILKLYVGYNPIFWEKITSLKMLKNTMEKIEDKYIARLFEPYSEFAGSTSMHTAYIKIGDLNKIYTEDMNIINNYTIVEFAYDSESTLDHPYNWKPLRIRYDKTEQFKREGSISGTANDHRTANNIWKLIQNPIGFNIIRSGKIPENTNVDTEEEVYYSRNVARDKSISKNMLDFHNKYIKNIQMFAKFRNKKTRLLDLACGKGGDMPKWIENNYTFVLGVDITSDNIENPNNGAWKRYSDIKERNREMRTEIVYVVGDCGKNIKDGSFTDNVDYTYVSKILWGTINEIDIPDTDRSLKKYLGKALDNGGFDLISCQFAIHYFFKNKISLDEYVKNISENLKTGGYFIGTCFDGNVVYKKLYDIDRDHYISGEKDGKIIWRIEKKYDNIDTTELLPNDERCLGLPMDVYIETINQVITEYLVNFNYLVTVFESHGLRLLSTEQAQEIGFINNTGLFSEFYDALKIDVMKPQNNRLRNCLQLSDAEKELSFMNRWFVFTTA